MQKYCTFPNLDTFDFWIQNNLNVLFYGRHGVGKTSMIINAFEHNKIKYQMFSASTMDPWVDFIGVPKEQHDEKGAYLELVRPKSFRDDEIEALFFDELNRSHKKIRNAIMELIQFKSINGRKFPNLRFVWGAVNPNDDENMKYDVEELDPAQADRFHVHVEIPYKPYAPYMRDKYGRDFADAAIEWWERLPPKVQAEVSPRRLEYAMNIYQKGGNLLYVLPQNSNIDKLTHNLQHGSPHRKFAELIKNDDSENLKIFLSDENNFDAVYNEIVEAPTKCLHLIEEEKVCALIHRNISIAYYVCSDYLKFKNIINNLADNSLDKNIRQMMIKSRAQHNKEDIFNTELLRANTIPISMKYRLDRIKNTYEYNDRAEMKIPTISNKLWKLNNLGNCVNHAINKIGDSNERLRIMQSIAWILSSNHRNTTKDEALASMNLFEIIASKTQSSTIKRHADFIHPTINICAKVLKNHEYIKTIDDFVVKFPNIACKIVYFDSYQPVTSYASFLKPKS